ncbi:MAG: antibiotic biosynthesis monooxygenase family protein [Terriglobia bacterium]
MNLTTIATQNNVVTLINVFSVAPENQQQLLDLLVHATREVMSKQPGFVSASFHRSLDGTRVVNYAQWASKEAFEAMIQNPEARPHMEAAAKLATYDAHLYEVSSTHESAN